MRQWWTWPSACFVLVESQYHFNLQLCVANTQYNLAFKSVESQTQIPSPRIISSRLCNLSWTISCSRCLWHWLWCVLVPIKIERCVSSQMWIRGGIPLKGGDFCRGMRGLEGSQKHSIFLGCLFLFSFFITFSFFQSSSCSFFLFGFCFLLT